jgi:hypothetical protein
LDAAWGAVTSEGANRARNATKVGAVRKAMSALRRLPELKQDDPHRPDYHAGCALVLLLRSLDYASTTDLDKAKDCLYDVASLCDGIDVTLTAAPGQTFMYDPKNPPQPGELETKELRAQVELLESLRAAAAPDAALIETLRQRARADAAIYEAIVPHLTAS